MKLKKTPPRRTGRPAMNSAGGAFVLIGPFRVSAEIVEGLDAEEQRLSAIVPGTGRAAAARSLLAAGIVARQREAKS